MSTIKTSESHPILVDSVDLPRVKGRLGLTFAPGKNHDGMTALWRRDLQQDLTRLKRDFGVDVLVCLLESHELRNLQIENLLPRAHRAGLKVIRYPIKDGDVPSSVSSSRALVERLVGLLTAGKTVAVFCQGGLGRTGAIAACTLVHLGETAEHAIQRVRKTRPGAIETAKQEKFIHAYQSATQRTGAPGEPIALSLYEMETVGVIAEPTDETSWKTEPMPEKRARLNFDLHLTPAQMEVVQFGLKPLSMDDKWFIYWKAPWLHFHRSWTGHEIYRARFEETDEGWRAVEAWVNRDLEQCKGNNDLGDSGLLLWMIGRLLLDHPIPFPPHDASATEGG